MPVLGGYQIQVLFRGATGSFSRIAGIRSETSAIDSTSQDLQGAPYTQKVPGKYSCNAVTFSAGYMIPLQKGGGWWNNVEGVQRGDVGAHEECVISFFAANIPAPVLIVTLQNAWPSKWSAGDMSVARNVLWAETIVMQCESIDFSWDVSSGGG
jgi:hypothetical protein